ncbi:MAG: DEAD/DEAH box helicase [Planctomycetes bacterium]|nr:DEAD/DEAH box helicase [Planctomycetota bacterium]
MYTESDPAPAEPFAHVPAPLRPALARRGFATLTPVQQAVLAAEDGVRDLQVQSQTGSGKTVALGFALATRLLADAGRQLQGPTTLIITPTRELAMQVCDELTWLFADVRGVTFDCVTGGTNVDRERLRLRRRPTVLVGTPGRLLDHLGAGALDCSGVTQLVLDEADQMLDMGFRDELEGILATMPGERRTHLVSATFATEVRRLTLRYQRDPLLIAGSDPDAAHADIEHVVHLIGPREHYAAVVNLLLMAGDERTLLFVRTRADTTGLADKLAGDGFAAAPISGDLAQNQRVRTLEAFRRGTITTLVATDVAARGLDIQDVKMVVHVHPPIDAETYTHRSGRTGRAGQKGRSVVLIPKPRERAVGRLLEQAGVAAAWLPVPGADAVRARQHERISEQVRVALARLRPNARQLELAEALLGEHQPAALVAGLLASITKDAARAPFQFAEVPEHRPWRSGKGGRVAPTAPARLVTAEMAVDLPAPKPVAASAPRPQPVRTPAAAPLPAYVPVSTPRSAPEPMPEREPEAMVAAAESAVAEVPAPRPRPVREPRTGPLHERRGQPRAKAAWHQAREEQPRQSASAAAGERGFQRFRINWGFQNGAEPRRILAHVCRRGGIDSKMVGAIEMQGASSTFDVSDVVAASFARRVGKRDPRDPELRITPV